MQGSQAEVTALIVEWLRLRRKEGDTLEALAKLLGVTKTAISLVVSTERGVGPKIEEAFAKRFYGESIDALRKAAHEAALKRGTPAPIQPGLVEAADFLRSRGHPVDVVLDRAALAAAKIGELRSATWIVILSDMLDVHEGQKTKVDRVAQAARARSGAKS